MSGQPGELQDQIGQPPWPWHSGYRRWGLTGLVKPEGCYRPKFYFFGFEDFDTESRVFFPAGIHWLVKFARDIRFLGARFLTERYMLGIRGAAELAAYHRGVEFGRKLGSLNK